MPVSRVGALDGRMVVSWRERLGLRARVANVPGSRAASAVVAALLDPMGELLDRRHLWVEFDGCRLRDWVRVNGDHAGPSAEHPLDDALLRGVVEVADVQDRARRRALEGLAH
jgi:hypothetical protein